MARFLTGNKGWSDLKDTFVVWSLNVLINRVASPQYRGKLTLILSYGLSEAEAGNIPGLEKRL